MRNCLNSVLNWIAKNFREDASKMLIWTGAAGWALSSAAQMCAILFNPKISNEQKSYLLPQELADAAVNIGTFFAVTQLAKLTASKLFKTGKFAPKNVREFITNNKPDLKDKIGKLNFNLGEFLESRNASCLKDYNNALAFGTTVATIGGGILSTNIITPIARNNMATKAQKNYLNFKEKKINNQPTFKANPNYKYDLKI